MLNESDSFDLAELSDRGGVSQRTVRYYIQQGLLPSPEARGPGAHYGAEHLDRLRLIRRLQREHLPLAEIRRRMETLDPSEIRGLVEGEPDRPAEDAGSYIRAVLSGVAPTLREQAPPRNQKSPDQFAAGGVAMPGWKGATRSQWDRLILGPDVELHVRRPLSREQNKQIERLKDAARHIFEEPT